MINFDGKLEVEKRQIDITEQLRKLVNIPGEPELDAQYKELIRGGICYALSMEWLRLIVVNGGNVNDDFGALEMCEDEVTPEKKSLAYYKQIANNFFAYATQDSRLAGIRATNNYASIEMDKTMVKMCMADQAKVVAEKTATALRPTARIIMDNHDGNLMFIRLIMNQAAHRIAGYRADANTLYIYDPNIGTIMLRGINDAELEDKVELLFEQLHRKYGFNQVTVRYLV